MIDQNISPKTHLSFSQDGWILIHQGSPLCDYKDSYEEVMRVVAHYRITLPPVTWNGGRMEWVSTDTIQELNHDSHCPVNYGCACYCDK
jgi:hypothetical protein